MHIKVKRLHPDAKLPTYAHPGDIGLDLYCLEGATVQPGEKKLFHLGFAMEFPQGYGAIVKDKGSISMAGLHAVGGVYDAGYRGEYNVALVHLGHEPYTFEKGQKVAQLLILPIIIGDIEETDTLSDSARGDGKWGSTGKF